MGSNLLWQLRYDLCSSELELHVCVSWLFSLLRLASADLHDWARRLIFAFHFALEYSDDGCMVWVSWAWRIFALWMSMERSGH